MELLRQCQRPSEALASLLAEIGAFQEGLEGLQESERLIGSEQGLASHPWLQFAKVVLYRGAGDNEAALAIANGLAEDHQVGFNARVQRAELLMNLGDARAEAATLGQADPLLERINSARPCSAAANARLRS